MEDESAVVLAEMKQFCTRTHFEIALLGVVNSYIDYSVLAVPSIPQAEKFLQHRRLREALKQVWFDQVWDLEEFELEFEGKKWKAIWDVGLRKRFEQPFDWMDEDPPECKLCATSAIRFFRHETCSDREFHNLAGQGFCAPVPGVQYVVVCNNCKHVVKGATMYFEIYDPVAQERLYRTK